jgi:peroxiredoxin
MRRGLSLLTVVAVAGAIGCTPAAPPTTAAPPPVAAAPLPATHLEGLDGSPTDLAAAVGGRVALVSLWATWCESCVAEVGALSRLDAQTRAQSDAIVVAVAVGEPRATVAAFTHDRALPYRVLVDPEFELADALGQRRVPATLVVDRTGHIVHRGGALDEASLAAFREAAKGGS